MKTVFLCLRIIFATIVYQSVVSAQANFFSPVTDRSLPTPVESVKNVLKKDIFHLNEYEMRAYLAAAPLEFYNNGVTIPMEVPLPDGRTEVFNLVESPIIEPGLEAKFPEIKSYTGNGTKNKAAVIRVTLTSLGLSAIILNLEGGTVYFEHYSRQDKDVYFNYYIKDAIAPDGLPHCGVNGDFGVPHSNKADERGPTNNTGASLRNFRIAVAANGEFTALKGGTVAGGLAAVTSYVSTLTAVFRNELCVSFTLVANNNLVIYTNSATDPYDNNDQGQMIDANRTTLDNVIGTGNYDVGHVWGYTGGSGGGVAYTGVVCNNTYKGGGTSGEGSAPWAQIFFDQLFCHEVGHQFNMNHSYNSSIPVCTTRNPATSVEPGSGCTIMSYGFTCGSDDYFSSTTTGPILNFHTVNYQEAVNYIAGVSCFTTSATGNTAPVVTMPSAFTIPKSTPFSLTGSGNTPGGGDTYTYSWEGTNTGTSVPNNTTLDDTAEPPFFRSYEPSTSPTRTYPILSAILNGTNQAKGDKLPSVGIATTHRLSIRDNNAVGGGLSYGAVTITVNNAIGPFLETTNLAGSYAGNSSQNITWSVNGTNAATPNVKISLSTDGGTTFAYVLAASTANDGSESVTLPNVATTQARIKVEAVGNIFFDISNSNFTITASVPVELVAFNAVYTGNKNALLTWETATEKDNKGFEIQFAYLPKTGGELQWRTLGFVAGNGTTQTPHRYSFTHFRPQAGDNYYRLRQLDTDGRENFTPIRVVSVPETDAASSMRLYPNPVSQGQLTLAFPVRWTDAKTVRIFNAVGQVVLEQTLAAAVESLDVSRLPEGMYTVQAVYQSEQAVEKIWVVGEGR